MSKTVMIVDDSGSFRTVVKLALQKSGYETVEAVDGQDAVTKLDGRKLNLIVCDVNMPNMDGLSFLRHLKTTGSYKFIPVIMLTTESQEAKKAEGKAAGARAWITKPFQPSQLVDAGDGEEAMDKLDGQPFGLIVSDLAMPRMDGLSFLRWLRVHPRYKFTPLLILTTETRKKVKESARQMGAQGILAKPCTPTQLVTAVQRLCR